MTDFATSHDGIRIAYEAHGEGSPALVFVHGWSCDRGYWKGQLGPFSGQFRVVAVDLAGHGESGLGRGEWTIEAFGRDVAGVVESLDLPRLILIGHSMGGDVTVEAARCLRGRVAALVWIDVYNRLGTPMTDDEIRALAERFRVNFAQATQRFVRGMFSPHCDPALVERVVADMAAAPPEVALGSLESAKKFEREIPSALGELSLPVVAINADDRPTDVASLARHGVEVVVMPKTSHFLMMEDPERFNGLLRAAIEDRLCRPG